MNNHIVNQPGRIYISDGNGSCVTDEHYLYDGAGSYTTAPTAGMVTKHVKALTSCWSGDPTNDGNWTMTAWGAMSWEMTEISLSNMIEERSED